MSLILKICAAALGVVILLGAALGLAGVRRTLGQGARSRPSPTPTAAQDIKRAEEARRKDEEHNRLTAVAKENLGRKLEQIFKRCPDGHRYSLKPLFEETTRFNLIKFTNLSWYIRPTSVSDYEAEQGVEWRGAVFSTAEAPTYVYDQEYNKETGGWRVKTGFHIEQIIAYGSKLKDKDWELKSDYEAVDCSLVTSSKQTILDAIDPELAAINRDFIEATAHADALMKRLFRECATGVWCLDDCVLGNKLYQLYAVHYQFTGLRPELKPIRLRFEPGAFEIRFVAESSRINECDLDSNKTAINCGWRPKGKVETDTRLKELFDNDQYLPRLLRKEQGKWFLEVYRAWNQIRPEWVEVTEALSFTPIDHKNCK